jgi:uncharacterized membrane protein (Fun14 family)
VVFLLLSVLKPRPLLMATILGSSAAYSMKLFFKNLKLLACMFIYCVMSLNYHGLCMGERVRKL